MAPTDMDHSQRNAARLAGMMYLLTMVSATFGDFYVRRQVFIPSDPSQTIKNIAASSALVRAGIASDLVTIAGSVILSVALYVLLNPVKKSAALVALFWWLLECSVVAVVTLNTLAVLFSCMARVPSPELAAASWTRWHACSSALIGLGIELRLSSSVWDRSCFAIFGFNRV